MVKRLEEAVIARLKKGEHIFEILVDSEKAFLFREGKIKDVRECLVYDEIFKDARKGERVSYDLLRKVFGTDDIYKVAEIIIKEGELQISTQLRRKLVEEKKKQIIEYIRRNAIDPRTGLPHTYQRIEEALEKAGVKIDPFKPVEVQIDQIIKKLKLVLPLKFEKVLLAVRIPPEYVGHAYGYIKRKYKISKEEWASDGSWIFLIEIPAGMKDEVIENIQKITEGNAEIKELKK